MFTSLIRYGVSYGWEIVSLNLIEYTCCGRLQKDDSMNCARHNISVFGVTVDEFIDTNFLVSVSPLHIKNGYYAEYIFIQFFQDEE